MQGKEASHDCGVGGGTDPAAAPDYFAKAHGVDESPATTLAAAVVVDDAAGDLAATATILQCLGGQP